MSRRTSRRVVPGLLVLLATGALAGCSGGTGYGTTASPAAAAPTPASPAASASPAAGGGGAYGGGGGYGRPAPSSTPAAAAAGTSVAVTETEMSIGLAATTMAPGTYTFVSRNTGTTTHALKIVGPGVNGLSSGSISPGQSRSLTVTLATGSYDFFCPVANHRMLGMDVTVTVS